MIKDEYLELRDDPILEKVIEHSGIKGQKKGHRRFQTYDGKYTDEGKIRYGRIKNPSVFISGSSKTQFEDSGYFRKELPSAIQNKIRQYMKDGKTILVGDAPGIDRQVQDFLNGNNYMNVEVYSPGKKVRYSANEKWNTNLVDVPGAEEGSGEWLRGKDEAMTEKADEGLAIILDEGAKATRNNVERLNSQNKKCDVFQLNKNGKDKWVKHSVEDDKGLMHYGKLGMKWGQRLYQNEDGSLTALGRIHYGRQLKKWKRKGYLEEDGSLNLKGYHKLSKKDEKWAQKHNDDIYKIAMDKSRKEMRDYRINQLNRQFSEQVKSGRVGLAYVNSYNKKLAEVLTKNVSHIKTPNLEKTISFIAKRGELGAYMAISDQGSDLSQYKNGIYRGGRVAYRKNVVNQIPAYRK